VSEVTPGASPGEATRVAMVCLDDDAQGRPLTIFWELELGARVLAPETHGLGAVTRLDPPRHFAAYLHALRWNAVTATDARLFQAPFRAGIQLFNHQLTPLKRALEMPRANLFIADDVGLGKTIEAGLVLQELLLRQRVEQVLIVCPASVTLQWRDEMQRKFGLQFEIYDREVRRPAAPGARLRRQPLDHPHPLHHLVPDAAPPRVPRPAARPPRRARAQVAAHPRRGPHRRARLRLALRRRLAHHEGDPRRGAALRAPPLSLGHAAQRALQLLLRAPGDPRPAALHPRRPRDPRGPRRGDGAAPQARPARPRQRQFPERRVVELAIEHVDGQGVASTATARPSTSARRATRRWSLSHMLAEYTALVRPAKGPGRLVFVNLQKRLLSSVEAFSRTLQLHARAVGKGGAAPTPRTRPTRTTTSTTTPARSSTAPPTRGAPARSPP
jgi:hypothetical protein